MNGKVKLGGVLGIAVFAAGCIPATIVSSLEGQLACSTSEGPHEAQAVIPLDDQRNWQFDLNGSQLTIVADGNKNWRLFDASWENGTLNELLIEDIPLEFNPDVSYMDAEIVLERSDDNFSARLRVSCEGY